MRPRLTRGVALYPNTEARSWVEILLPIVIECPQLIPYLRLVPPLA